MSGTPSGKSPTVSHWRSGSWAVETGGSLSISSCSRTAAPIGRGRPKKERSAPDWATPSSPKEPSARTMRPPSRQEKNGWRPTPASLLSDIEKACVEHGHGGLWNSMNYHTREVVSIDMKACYPASFRGMDEAKPYFERFGQWPSSIRHWHWICRGSRMGV